jgi:hypothetical protein
MCVVDAVVVGCCARHCSRHCGSKINISVIKRKRDKKKHTSGCFCYCSCHRCFDAFGGASVDDAVVFAPIIAVVVVDLK